MIASVFNRGDRGAIHVDRSITCRACISRADRQTIEGKRATDFGGTNYYLLIPSGGGHRDDPEDHHKYVFVDCVDH